MYALSLLHCWSVHLVPGERLNAPAGPAALQPLAMTSPARAWTCTARKPRCASLQGLEAAMCRQTESLLPVSVRKRQWLDSWLVWEHLTQTNLNHQKFQKNWRGTVGHLSWSRMPAITSFPPQERQGIYSFPMDGNVDFRWLESSWFLLIGIQFFNDFLTFGLCLQDPAVKILIAIP